MQHEAEGSYGFSALVATSVGLVWIIVAAGAILLVSDPEFTANALWTFSDTGHIQSGALLGFVMFLAWSLITVRYCPNATVSVLATIGLYLASLYVASRVVRASMLMGNSEYVHFVPGTWSLMLAWTVGACAALTLAYLIRLAMSRSRSGKERVGV